MSLRRKKQEKTDCVCCPNFRFMLEDSAIFEGHFIPSSEDSKSYSLGILADMET